MTFRNAFVSLELDEGILEVGKFRLGGCDLTLQDLKNHQSVDEDSGEVTNLLSSLNFGELRVCVILT